MNKLQQLIEAAKAAAVLDHNEAEAWYSAESMETYAFFPKNARFMAACDPATILELCVLLEKAEDSLDACSTEEGPTQRELDRAREALAAIKQWKEQQV